MNIVYLNHYAGSPRHGMEYRPYYLAREWVRAGHAVTMLAAAFSHVRATQPADARGQPLAAPACEQLDGITYRWYPAPAYQGNGLGRVKNIWAFLRQLWSAAPALVAELKPDVVIASSTYPMDIWVARRIARLARAKLVFEVHDLWPLSPIELSGMSPRHPFIMLCQAGEDAAYRDADLVVSMLPKVAGHMSSRGLDLSRLIVVPNGISPDDWGLPAAPASADPAAAPAAPTVPTAPLRADVAAAINHARQRGRSVVGYAGSMGLPNALDDLLDALKLLAARQPGEAARLQVVLVGDGHERQRLQQRIAAEGLETLAVWLPPIPKAQIPALLAAIDIAYIGWQKVPIYRFGIAPNKLMDYMMAGCCVLHAVEAGNDPVAEAGCGLTVAPQDPAAIAAGLLQLAGVPVHERATMGARGRAFVRAHHAYPVLARRFIDAVAAAPRRGR
jgi:glycosyltransferase involved in cell wall biosynthesis